jgi:hypothetical protein
MVSAMLNVAMRRNRLVLFSGTESEVEVLYKPKIIFSDSRYTDGFVNHSLPIYIYILYFSKSLSAHHMYLQIDSDSNNQLHIFCLA